MEKKDCVFYVTDCGTQNHREILRQARIRGRKLIVITNCSLENALAFVRAIASDNMDFPLRHYHRADIAQVEALEGCRSSEILNPILERIVMKRH